MTFKDYLNDSWNLHATESQTVFNGFEKNFDLIESNNDVQAIANLIVHVCGEHLGKWNEGLELLKKLKTNSFLSDVDSFNRFIAILNLGSNANFAINHLRPSDQARILAVTSSALASQNDLKRAEKYLKAAHEIALNELTKEDPANRSLAITGNNLACALEEKESRSQEETELMKLAALVGRKFWEISGSWKEVERAEYRLANTYLQAKEYDQALHHAKACLTIVESNQNEPLEAFFGYEALALVEIAKNNQNGFSAAKMKMEEAFNKLSSDDQSWTKASLDKIK